MTEAELTQACAALGDARKAVQRPAAEQLAQAARSEPRIRALLATELWSADPRRRWGAAYALAHVEGACADAIPVLLEMFGTSDGDIRWAAARLVVGAMPRVPDLAARLERLLESPSALQRKMALYCLRDGAAPGSVTTGSLVRALEDVDPAVRLAAMAACLAVLPPGPEGADLVAKLVADADAGVRRAAAATLGRHGVATARVLEMLTGAAASSDATLARVASQALSRLGCPVRMRP